MKLKAIIPQQLALDPKRLLRGIQNGMDASAKAVKVDFGVTTQTWKRKVEFTIQETDEGRIVGTDDEIYGYVNDGTKPHIIVAKNSPTLVFTTPFGPKTTVRVIGSLAGSRGSTVHRPKAVKHPGTEAREFDETIAKKWRELFPRTLQRSLDAEVD